LNIILSRLSDHPNNALFGFSGCRMGNDMSVVGPLHWACLYGQVKCFQLLTSWICEEINPEHLFEITGCNCSSSVLHSAVPGLYRHQLRIAATLQIVNLIVAMLPGGIQYNLFEPSL